MGRRLSILLMSVVEPQAPTPAPTPALSPHGAPPPSSLPRSDSFPVGPRPAVNNPPPNLDLPEDDSVCATSDSDEDCAEEPSAIDSVYDFWAELLCCGAGGPTTKEQAKVRDATRRRN